MQGSIFPVKLQYNEAKADHAMSVYPTYQNIQGVEINNVSSDYEGTTTYQISLDATFHPETIRTNIHFIAHLC